MMKKRITIVLEVESEDEDDIADVFILNDLKGEIDCAYNSYEIKEFKTEQLT